MKKTFNVIATIKEAWKLFLIHKKFYLKTVLIFGSIAVVADILGEDDSKMLVDIVLSIISGVAGWYGSMVLMKASLSVSASRPITPDVSRLSFETILYLLAASVLVSIGSVIGLILLIIPGVIFAARTMLTQYIILDEKVGPIVAIKKSMVLTKGYFWSIVRTFLVLGVLTALSVFPLLGLGFIVLVPLSTLALSLIYRKLQISSEVITSEPAL